VDRHSAPTRRSTQVEQFGILPPMPFPAKADVSRMPPPAEPLRMLTAGFIAFTGGFAPTARRFPAANGRLPPRPGCVRRPLPDLPDHVELGYLRQRNHEFYWWGYRNLKVEEHLFDFTLSLPASALTLTTSVDRINVDRNLTESSILNPTDEGMFRPSGCERLLHVRKRRQTY